jgi:hypothetical protein
MARVDIHADMLTLQAAYPWQCPEFVAAEDAEIVAFHDEAREAWLDDWLADLEEEEDELIVEYMAPPTQPQWLTDFLADVEIAVAKVASPDYQPFQRVDYYCSLADEIGYAESVTPYMF